LNTHQSNLTTPTNQKINDKPTRIPNTNYIWILKFDSMSEPVIKLHNIPPGDIQHGALEHDIRTIQTRQELDRSVEKSKQLDTYRKELLEKVNKHLDELHQLDERKERTSVFKNEMLCKVNEHIADIEKEHAKKEEVAKFKAELIAKVHEHAEELDKMDATKVNLTLYKTELMAKVEEHTKEWEHAQEKAEQVRRLSAEMIEKVNEFQAHLAERARLTETLKKSIMKEAKSFNAREWI